jgi:hypothetical protein
MMAHSEPAEQGPAPRLHRSALHEQTVRGEASQVIAGLADRISYGTAPARRLHAERDGAGLVRLHEARAALGAIAPCSHITAGTYRGAQVWVTWDPGHVRCPVCASVQLPPTPAPICDMCSSPAGHRAPAITASGKVVLGGLVCSVCGAAEVAR